MSGADDRSDRGTRMTGTTNITYMKDCSNITIGGNTSTATVCVGQLVSQPATSQEGDATKKSKNLAGIHVVQTILEENGRPIPYAELEREVKSSSAEHGFKSFNKLSGWSLLDFLVLNKDSFDVIKRRGAKLVKLHRKQKSGQRKIGPSVACEETDDYDKSNDDTQQGWTEAKQKSKTIHSEAISKETTATENTKGKSVVETFSNPDAKIRDVTAENLRSKETETDQINSESQFCDPELFRNLVSKGDSIHVRLVDCIHTYETNPLRFSLDVVSMWNTPQRIGSHIIIGVRSNHELIGVEKYVEDEFFNTLFQTSFFTMMPLFKCCLVMFDSKPFYVIEIASSCGYACPSIVKKTGKMGNVNIEENQLWVRHETSNVVCQPSDLAYGSIYHWFLGPCKQQRQTAKVITQTCVSPNVRNAGTQSPTDMGIEKEDNAETCSLELINIHTANNFQSFWDMVRGFKKGHFVLLTGDVCCSTKHIDAFGLVPWLCVYDFDIFSGSDGLLNVVQDSLEKRRHLKTYCWNDTPEHISERGTRWCFLRGRREISSSRTDDKDENIEDPNAWFKSVRKAVGANCERLCNFVEDYTVLTIVMLWPENEKLVPFMTKFLTHLTDALPSTPNIVLCMNTAVPKTKTGTSRYETFCDDYSNILNISQVKFENICIGIENAKIDNTDGETVYRLPRKEDPDETMPDVHITEKDATWLAEDLEVLYSNIPYARSALTTEEVEKEVTSFFKGGTLPWFAWYKNVAAESVIDRSIQKQLESKLQKHLADYKTTIMTLFHAPGSGGTTLAQKVLWKLHKTFPCIHLKLRTNSQIEELDRKTTFLYEKTDLPILLLVDAEEESKVRLLSRRLKYTVILYVKRYPYKIPFALEPDRVFLSGYVTADESRELGSKLGELCGDDVTKRRRLDGLTKDVIAGRNHCMYEYGLTVYLHEFKGIVSYVEGYLELKRNVSKELTSCQRCLAYLALVYYYGQTCVPCQFFSALFHKLPNFVMTLEDFPSPIGEFVVYDKNEGRNNNIRICHFIIAKEILEQILSRHVPANPERTVSLSQAACWSLSSLCTGFIEYASNKRIKSTKSTAVMLILTKTFIFRDERDMGDNEEQVRKRPVLSKLMIDIPAGKPLFTERLRVLQKLVDSFPDDPNFRAHLGRFYAFCRPDEEHEAEKCFQKAVQLCDDQVMGKSEENIDDGMKLTMMHIYHMYGIIKQKYIARFTGRSEKEKVVAFGQNEIFNEQIEDIVTVAEEACDYFTRSRNITPENHDVYTYAYTGEIQVRLQICEFVNRHFKTDGDNSIVAFLQSGCIQIAKTFVKRSISIIENLILECYMDVDLLDKDLESLRKQVTWYNNMFKKQVMPLEEFSYTDDISNRRLKIAAKKLKHGKVGILNGVETIDDEDDIQEIVCLYEANFADIQKFGFQYGDGKRELEREYRDWIFAIRHEKFNATYELEDVLTQIQFWKHKLGSPISVFYVFTVYSLLGFGNESTPGKTECLIEAKGLREHVNKMNHLVIKPKYPREWLGNSGDGIKRLKVGNRHVGLCKEDRDSTSGCRLDLAVCKGTICRPNTRNVSGMISMDLGASTVEVRVYFIPKVAKLDGSRFAGQRVEFNLAFTIQHGYEAYNVKLLKRHACPSCSRKIEFTSVENVRRCKCDHEVERDELTEVT